MKSQLKRDKNGFLELKSLDDVKKWDKKRVKAYKNRLHKHLSFIQQPENMWELLFEKHHQHLDVETEQLEKYIRELAIIYNDKKKNE